jgi:hypothetical protein
MLQRIVFAYDAPLDLAETIVKAKSSVGAVSDIPRINMLPSIGNRP